jgi:hypothetical protein
MKYYPIFELSNLIAFQGCSQVPRIGVVIKHVLLESILQFLKLN